MFPLIIWSIWDKNVSYIILYYTQTDICPFINTVHPNPPPPKKKKNVVQPIQLLTLLPFICVERDCSFVTWILQRVTIWMPSKSVCPLCGERIHVFIVSWLRKWNIHGGVEGLAAEQRACWQGWADSDAFWGGSRSLSPSRFIKRWVEEERTDKCDSVFISAQPENNPKAKPRNRRIW